MTASAEKKNIVKFAAVAIVLAALVTLYGLFDPATSPFPRCPFHALTGFDCPGCGSQRAIHSLLHLDVAAAWRYNALLVISLPFVAGMLFAGMFRTRYPRFYNAMNSRQVILTSLAVILGWSMLRNII